MLPNTISVIDKLNFYTFIYCLQRFNYKKVIILELQKNKYYKILNLLRYTLESEDFFLGDIIHDNESLYISVRKHSSLLSVEVASELSAKLNTIHKSKFSDVFISRFSKLVFIDIEYVNARVSYLKHRYPDTNFDFCCKINQLWFKEVFLSKFQIKPNKISFYNSNFFSSHFFSKINFYKHKLAIRLKQIFQKKNISPQQIVSKKKNRVLSILDEEYAYKKDLRSSLFWTDGLSKENLEVSLVPDSIYATNTSIQEGSFYKSYNSDIYITSYENQKYSKIPMEILNIEENISRAISSSKQWLDTELLFVAYKIFRLSRFISSVVQEFQITHIIMKESYLELCDAAIISARMHKISSVNLQYSNLPFPSVIMQSPSTIFALFSPIYIQNFKSRDFVDQKFIFYGYPFAASKKSIQEASRKKIYFQNQGYSIIISFFDESIQHDKFGCFSFKRLKQDLEFLAKTAMEINALVLFKPQFSWNSIQHIFKDSSLINDAFSSKNFITLSSGKWRNNILPYSVGLISDLSIGSVVGGTASLETAIHGIPSFLIDASLFDPSWADCFGDSKSNIFFDDLESLISQLYQAGVFDNPSKLYLPNAKLGNWELFFKQSGVQPFSNGLNEIFSS